MLDFLVRTFFGIFEWFAPAFRLFGGIYEADERPVSRGITIGCAGLFIVGFILLWFVMGR